MDESNPLIQKFITLRAANWSFARLARELEISKPTLIAWSRKYHHDIQNLRAIETEALAEQLLVSRQERWEFLGRDLRRIEAELANRDFTKLPTERLLTLAITLRKQVQQEISPLRFTAPAAAEESTAAEPLNWEV